MRDIERRSFITRMGALAAVVPIALVSVTARARTTKRPPVKLSADERLQAMEKQMEQMATRLGMLEDVQAIRRLQHAYGYYLDKSLYEEVIGLFAEDGAVRLGRGLYQGRVGQRRFYTGFVAQSIGSGASGPSYGVLREHLQLQDIIDVAADRRSAQGRIRCFMQAGAHETKKDVNSELPRQWWEGAICENTYAKGEDGLWRIKLLNYRQVYRASYEDGWAHSKPLGHAESVRAYPDDPVGPDELLPDAVASWPETPIVPFHYPHPVTGKPWV
ncbi:MAG TPA: nuclear transport factor 2 family protein [Steroidobacteraceae bacterium]|nr:nuclear transport factor 2 family protein [Steroidobacteraceae bacterium]